MENKTRAEIFPDPICLPFWVSLKVSFKKVICLLVGVQQCDHVSVSAGHLLGLVTCGTVPWNGLCVHLWGPEAPLPKPIKKTHVNTSTHMFSSFPLSSWRRPIRKSARSHLTHGSWATESHRKWLMDRQKKKKDQMLNKTIKVPPVWSSNYLLKHLLKSPPWFFQHAFHNRGILRIYCLQMADERQGQELRCCAHALTL